MKIHKKYILTQADEKVILMRKVRLYDFILQKINHSVAIQALWAYM
jgi:hypothetical protein